MQPLAMVRSTFPANPASVSRARRFVRDALRGWGVAEAIDDAELLTSELVTNAVIHARTGVEVVCRLADAAVQVEVVDGAPALMLPHARRTVARPPRVAESVAECVAEQPMWGDGIRTDGRGLLLPSELARTWGVTYGSETKTVWFRLETAKPVPREGARELRAPGSAGVADRAVGAADGAVGAADGGAGRMAAFDRVHPAELDRTHRGWISFLAEASDLLAGTLDEDMLVALSAQIVVPRLARWCAFCLSDPQEDLGEMRLTHVWHADERRLGALRRLLERTGVPGPDADGIRPWPAPGECTAEELVAAGTRTAVTVPLVARGRRLGVLVLGRAEDAAEVGDALWLAEDMGRRIALGLDNARMYSRQRAVSQILQRGLLPLDVPSIPGIEHCVVYEPAGDGHDVGGDFYDVFQVGADRWRFALGDVCGTGPEAAAVTGLARHTLRLLAREEYGVADVLDRLNRALLDEGARSRLITVLYGELAPLPGGGASLTIVSAGHPLPLLLSADGGVTASATPQLLLGAVPDVVYHEEKVKLADGDVLVCVTDGVTERRRGDRLLDDDDGLARMLSACTGMTAGAVAARVRRLVADFAPVPSTDDIAMLVLRAC